MSFKPDPAGTRKYRAAARSAERHLPSSCPPLLYLTDPVRSPNILRTASLMPPGSGVVYRHFGSESRVQTAHQLRRITWRSKSKLLIGNDPALAMVCRADGVHWPEVGIRQAAKWRGRFALMTGAAHSRAALAKGEKACLDAMLISTVFDSNSPSASRPMGTLKFRQLEANAQIPIYALGGITASNAEMVSSAGGLASISGIERAFGS